MHNDDMTMRTTHTVVVVGCNYCNLLTMTRALGRAGYSVDVVRVFKHKPTPTRPLRNMAPESVSRYTRRYSRCLTSGDGNLLVQYLMDHDAPQGSLLIPTDDFVLEAIDRAYDTLVQRYILPTVGGRQGGIADLMNKSEQKRLAQAAGLPVPDSRVIRSHDGAVDIPDDIPYPCFVKPNVSTRHNKGSMRMCSTPQELAEHLQRCAARGDIDMLVEEYQDIDTEYSLLGYCADGHAHCCGAIRISQGGTRERKGVAVTGCSIDPAELGDIVQGCTALLQDMQYSGMFDIDLLRTKDGRLCFVELNFRAGASTYVLCRNAANPAAEYTAAMLGMEHTPSSDGGGAAFVSEKVLMEEYARGDASLADIKKAMSGADVCFVRDDDDPAPYRYYRRYYAAAAVMRMLYRIKDR